MKFVKKDIKSFWKKKYENDTVNGISGQHVAILLKQNLLNSTNNNVNKKYISNKFSNYNFGDFIISPLDVKESVKDLKVGNSV